MAMVRMEGVSFGGGKAGWRVLDVTDGLQKCRQERLLGDQGKSPPQFIRDERLRRAGIGGATICVDI